MTRSNPHPSARRTWWIAVAVISVFVIVILALQLQSRSTPPSATATDSSPTATATDSSPTDHPSLAITPLATPLPPPPEYGDALALSHMPVDGPLTPVPLPPDTEVQQADPLQDYLSVHIHGGEQISADVTLHSKPLAFRGGELVDLPGFAAALREEFRGSEAVTCESEIYDGIATAVCTDAQTDERTAVFFDTAHGSHRSMTTPGLQAAICLGADRYGLIVENSQPPNTSASLDFALYDAAGNALITPVGVVGQTTPDLPLGSFAFTQQARISPTLIQLPQLSGENLTSMYLIDLERMHLSQLGTDVARAAVVWPGAGSLTFHPATDPNQLNPMLGGTDLQPAPSADISAQVFTALGTPLGLTWPNDVMWEPPFALDWTTLATAANFADLQAARATLAALDSANVGDSSLQMAVQILPEGKIITATLPQADATPILDLPPGWSQLDEHCHVPSIIAGDGDMLVCLTRVEADLVLHAYPRGATTPEFQQQLESMIEPRWMRIGRQTWFLNTGDTLYLAK